MTCTPLTLEELVARADDALCRASDGTPKYGVARKRLHEDVKLWGEVLLNDFASQRDVAWPLMAIVLTIGGAKVSDLPSSPPPPPPDRPA